MGLDASGQRTVPVPANGSDDWFDWVSPSQCSTWLSDSEEVPIGGAKQVHPRAPIVEWFKWIHRKRSMLTPASAAATSWVQKNQNVPHPQLDTNVHQRNLGVAFEDLVVQAIQATSLSTVTIATGLPGDGRNPNLVQNTVSAMESGVDVIVQGVLWEPTAKVYGICDLIVRSDKLVLLFDELQASLLAQDPALDAGDWDHEFSNTDEPAPNLDYNEGEGPYHYRAVDVKIATLSLKADGRTLGSKHKEHMGQLEIYTRCLENILGMAVIPEAYLLGKRSKWKTRGTTNVTRTCFSRLGIHRRSDDVWEQIRRLGAWRQRIRNEALVDDGTGRLEMAPGWNPLDRAVVVGELHGFAGITKAYDWEEANATWVRQTHDMSSLPGRDKLALRNSLWGIGRNQVDLRTLAIANLPSNTPPHVQNLVTLVQTPAAISIPPPSTTVVPPCTDLAAAWGPPSSNVVEFFVDFEFLSGAVDYDLQRFPEVDTMPDFIFMIGCTHRDPTTRMPTTVQFLTTTRTAAEETRIINEWNAHMQSVAAQQGASASRYFVWSNAEQTALNFAANRGAAQPTAPMVDLMCAVGNNLTFQGMKNRSLKTVTTVLCAIPGSGVQPYPSSAVQYGQAAMMVGFRAWKDGMNNGGTMANPTEPDPADPYLVQAFQDSLVYNERDCVVMMEILDYLRANHV
jgi:hypothetical protein